MLKAIPKRTRFLLALLAAVAVGAVVSAVQNTILRNELTVHAETKADTFRDDNAEVAYTITVGRPLVLFGEPFGKVTTFARPKGATGTDILTAVDYHFVKRGGEWVNTDSAMCSHDGCISGAEGAFARGAGDT